MPGGHNPIRISSRGVTMRTSTSGPGGGGGGIPPHLPPNNYDATEDPTVNDDTDGNWEVGSVWINTTTGEVFIAVDVTDGAALWVSTTNSNLGSPDLDALAHGAILFTMHRESDNRPYLLWSRDGITFTDPIGDMLFDFGASSRDPSLFHWDDAFWVAHTGPSDLEKFTIWRSDRLLSGWVQHDQPDCSSLSPFRVWAPEWFLDPSDDSVHILFAASATDFDDFSLYEIHPTDREMTTWSAPVALTGLSTHSNEIDPFVVYTNVYGDPDKPYKLFYKQERTEGPGVALAEAASLTGSYTVVEVDDWAGWVGARDSIEGFSLIEIEDGRWRAYFTENDGFGTEAHWYSDSTDGWATWSTPAETSWPWTPGHGTPLRLPSTIDLLRGLEAFAASGAAAFQDLSDVTITDIQEGEMPRWNGSAWVNDSGLIPVDTGTLAIDDGDPFGLTLTSLWGIDGTTPYYDDANVDPGDEAALFYDPLTDSYVLVAFDF